MTFSTTISHWPDAAQIHFRTLRDLIQHTARDIDTPLTESLKWGQPAWRPSAPRTGTTLRANWSASHPNALILHVDCKTDLAARMITLYPDLPGDGRRAIRLALDRPLPRTAIAHLATMTFRYFRPLR